VHKDFRFELKSLSDPGTFEGLAATYGDVDLGGDIIEPGAFQKTMADKGGEVPILWQHDQREPIGVGKLSDSRLLWVWLSRVWIGWRSALAIVQPETVLAWHRAGVRLFWTWKV